MQDINHKRALEAISRGDINILEDLLHGFLDINHTTGMGPSLLYQAVASGNNEIVKLLLSRGAYVNTKYIFRPDETPLHNAVFNGQEETVRILLEAGANVNATTRRGQTPLSLVLSNGSNDWSKKREIVKLLINKGANPVKTKHGDISLYEAVSNGEVELTKTLLENGADVNSKMQSEDSVLHTAVSRGNEEIVQLLINKGANIHAKAGNGETALHKAIWNNNDGPIKNGSWRANRKIIEILLKNDADITVKTNDGYSVLALAVKTREKELVEILLNRGASVDGLGNRADINSPEKVLVTTLMTALYVAADDENIELVRLLLKRGADVNAVTPNGENILSLAVRRENVDLVTLLVAHGADINNILRDGRTLLNRAIFGGRRDIVNVLLDNGADITATDNYGNTALHEAAHYGFLELVETLLEKGAKVDARNGDGDTPLHRAMKRHPTNDAQFCLLFKTDKSLHYTAHTQPGIIKVLLDNGADIEAKNRSQKTPLYYAAMHNKLDLVDFLLDNEADINYKSECGTNCISIAATDGTLSGDMIELLKRHIIKRKIACFYLNQEHLEKCPFNMVFYQAECNKEILYLKSEFIYDGFPLFDILLKPIDQLTYYLRDFTNSINFSRVKTNAAQYHDMIYSKIQKTARKRELLEYGKIFFDSLPVNVPILPYECRDYILSYLSNADLSVLEKLFK